MECSIDVSVVKVVAVLRFSVTLLIFCVLVLLITERADLKSTTVVMDLPISPWSPVSLHIF